MKRFFLLLALLLVFPLAHAEFKKEIVVLFANAATVKTSIQIDILKHVEPQLKGYKFVYQAYPWARAVEMAKRGKGGIIVFSKNKERLEIFDYSDALFVDEILLVTLAEKTFPFNSIEDLKGKTIGSCAECSFGDEFDQAKKILFRHEPIYTQVNTEYATIALKMLLAERIDAALIFPGKAGLEQAISSDPILISVRDRIAALPKPLVSDPNYLAFSKEMKMTGFLRTFNAALAAANKSGAVKKIIDAQLKQSSAGGKP